MSDPVMPVVIALPPEIDLTNASGVLELITAACVPGVAVVIADLTGTSFCDSAGLRHLIRAGHQAAAAGPELRLAIAPGRRGQPGRRADRHQPPHGRLSHAPARRRRHRAPRLTSPARPRLGRGTGNTGWVLRPLKAPWLRPLGSRSAVRRNSLARGQALCPFATARRTRLAWLAVVRKMSAGFAVAVAVRFEGRLRSELEALHAVVADEGRGLISVATDSGDDLDVLVGDAGIVREIFESMPLMLLGLTGPQHRVDAVNLAYRAALSRPEIVGMPVLEIFPEVVGQQLFEVLDRVFETGVPQVASGWRVQTRNPAADELEERYIDFTTVPRHDPSGTIVGLNLFAVETTGQVLGRRRLQQQAPDADERYEQARDVITALQRQLLPQGLPVLPAVQIAASYLLADTDDAAGGDWFDAVPVGAGRVALVVGDVVGHGVAASAAMGQLRAVLQDRLDDTGDITAAVAAADRMARRVPGARAATVCIVLLDPAAGTLTWSSAGHPPPLIAGPDRARFLPAPRHGPLGTGASYAVRHDRLEPGEVVLLYSDGIIERPGRTPAEASAELSQAVTDAVAGRGFAGIAPVLAVDRACTQTLELLVRQTGHTDDITLLAARRADPVPPVRLTRRADRAAIGAARAAVDEWADALAASERDRVAFAHAVVELVTNACEHARPDTGDATVTVTAGLRDDGEAWLKVTDDGRWRERDRPGDEDYRRDQGYGLAMTASLADHFGIDRGEAGTTVTFRRRLSRSARLLTADQISQGQARAPGGETGELVIAVQPDASGSRIAIRGPLDASTVEDLGTELDRLTLGGSHELTVDLTAVTHLASAVVAELYRTRPGTGTRQYPLRLYAPAGSTAHYVLSLVGLPHETQDPHRSQQVPPNGTELG